MDEKRVAQLGTKPLMADIAAVAAIKDKSEMARFMGASQESFGASIVGGGPMPIPTRRPSTSAKPNWADQGFPTAIIERQLYKPQREAYRAYIARTMKMIGSRRRPPMRCAAFETDRQGELGDRRAPRSGQQPDVVGRWPPMRPGSTGAPGSRARKFRRKSASSSTKIPRSATSPRSMVRRRSTR